MKNKSDFQSCSYTQNHSNVHQAAWIHHPHPSVSFIQLTHPSLPVSTPKPARFLLHLPSRQISSSIPHRTIQEHLKPPLTILTWPLPRYRKSASRAALPPWPDGHCEHPFRLGCLGNTRQVATVYFPTKVFWQCCHEILSFLKASPLPCLCSTSVKVSRT